MRLTDIKDLYAQYGHKSAGALAPDDQNALKVGLDSIKKITNEDDAYKFLKLLALLRLAGSKSIAGLGDSAMATITGAFAGGDEGVYAADTDLMNARFIFELVQNVDDCKYQDVNDCTLKIQFNFEDNIIRLEYNELGFQPENVVAITGLGNSTKNHRKAQDLKAEKEIIEQGDLQEIGEKGIGFKSIFGLANRVKITSQFFSFSIERDNFFVPIVEDYSNFSFSKSTVLELTLDDGMVDELYGFLKRKYDNVDAIINENPILFLNKLTEICYYRSESDYFGFKVSRSKETGAYSEDDTKIVYYSSDRRKNKTIDAYRFTHNIEYSVDECRSRYGENEESTRNHKIIVIAPKKTDMIKVGRIYSFFATSEEINAPFIIHAPFKLNSGRTRIDSQSQGINSNNKWFLRTKNETISMIHHVFERLAVLQGNQIRFYIPSDSLVGHGCAISCRELGKSNILTWNIFEAMDGDHYPASQVCMLSFSAEQDKLIEIHKVLSIRKYLLKIDAREIGLFRNLGIEEITGVRDKLLTRALLDETITALCLKYVSDYEPEFSLRNITESLTYSQLSELSKFERITQWINKHTFDYLMPGKIGAKIVCSFSGPSKDVSEIRLFCDEYGEAINKQFVAYLNRTKYFDCGFEHTVYTYNAVLGKNMLEDFAEAYHIIEPKDKFFYPFLRIEAVSEEIDRLCESGDSISDYEFLKALGVHRTNQKNMLKNQYGSILELIEKAGTSYERFFPEILQNIDDCDYSETPYSVIRSDCVDGVHKLYIEYNEVGFSREQIRAITAIGDSTKKKLLSASKTGEKGIGFKSVFALCSNVSIKSGNFCFILSAEKPTVPKDIREIEPHNGTQMVFTLRPVYANAVLAMLEDDKKIIKNCLCMKQMHNLRINQKELLIIDKNKRRTVKYGSQEYTYFLYEHPVKVNNTLALLQRLKNKNVHNNQVISYLVPLFNYEGEYCVYSTFPTQEPVKIQMQINMPLELDTARERIQEGEWNKEIIRQMMDGLPTVYEALKLIFKEKLPQCFPDNGTVLSHKYGQAPSLSATIINGKFFKLAFKNEFVSLASGVFSRDFEYSIFSQYAQLIKGDTPSKLLAKDDASYDRLARLFPSFIKERTFDEICLSVNSLLLSSKAQGNDLIAKKEFREALYHFLADSRDKNNKPAYLIRKWEIIPIKYQKHTKYEAYDEEIYAPGEGDIDSEKYKILDKQIMPVQMFDSIYANINNVYRNIRTFTKDIIIAEFFKEICSLVEGNTLPIRAEAVLNLFNREQGLFKETFKARKDFPVALIVFKTRTGDFRDGSSCFLCRDRSNQGCLEQIIVHEDYVALAELIGLKQVSDISNYNQIPFAIGRNELKELKSNKHLTHKTEIFNSLYLYHNRSAELKDGFGFFELYQLASPDTRSSKNQPPLSITIDADVLKKYPLAINDISISESPVSFLISVVLSEFEKDNILSEIEDELQLRKETDKTRKIKYMLANCSYASIMEREPCYVRGKNGSSLLIDTKITADYDIIEVLKAYFSKYFHTELSVNRNIGLYNRRGFENISTVVSSEADVAVAANMMNGINMLNIEDVKDFLCKPLTVNGVTFGGYAKTCPLCDSRVNTELTGMRIYKTKCEGTIIPLISCSNCHDSLRYSSNIEIDVEKMSRGLLDMTCQINGYEWRIRDKVIRLGHRALIRKMNSK